MDFKSAIIESRKEEFSQEEFSDEWHAFISSEDVRSIAEELLSSGRKISPSCGSLILYCLGVSDVKPDGKSHMYYDNSLPDIDVDFSDTSRHLVFEHMEEKYGRDRIARLGTVAMYQPRSALKEAGAALDIPPWEITPVIESLIQRSSGDSRALNTLEDTLTDTPAGQTLLRKYPGVMAVKAMEGHARHHSQHAAGIVLTENSVSEYVAIDGRTGATHCDKKDAEAMDLLKIDALGLTQLSVFEDAMEDCGMQIGDLEKIPLDDPEAFKVLNERRYAGIFQFNGMALQSLAKQIQFTHFDDIVAITALARPGPLASGGANEWVKRKIGLNPVTYPHPLFEPYLNNSLGIVIYQEQVMEIGRNVGNLTWEDVTALRKAMSKSLGKEFFDQYGDRFKVGAIAQGVPEEVAAKVWDDLCLSGDTVLINPHPSKGSYSKITLKQLYDRGGLGPEKKVGQLTRKRQKLLMWDGESLKPFDNWGVKYSGKKQTYTLATESGNVIHATENHKFLQQDGTYVELKDLKVGGHVMSNAGTIPTERKMKKGTGAGGHNWWHKLREGAPSYQKNREYLNAMFKNCQHCKSAPYEETHHINMDHEDHRIENLLPVCRKCHKLLHSVVSGSPTRWNKGFAIAADSIISIEPRCIEDVYDVHMPDPHNNFLASGIVVHNCAYGSWSFNLSHSVAYGMISYWCAWFKAHHPVEFAAATLTHESDANKQIVTLREMAAEGISFLPVHRDHSEEKWKAATVDGERKLVGPLQNVVGLGPKLVQQIMSAKARQEPIPPRAEKLLNNPKTSLDSLFPIRDAFLRLMPDPAARNIHTPPSRLIDLQMTGTVQRGVVVFVVVTKIAPRDENEAVNVAKRGYVIDGPHHALNLQITDDTDTMLAKVRRFDYADVGKPIVDRGKPGKALYAMKGDIGANFRMMDVKVARYIGDIND